MIGFREFVILVIVKLNQRLLVKYYGNSKGLFIKVFLLNRKKMES